MSDTDALEGENAEGLVKLGERLLKQARGEAGKLRMADAKRKLSAVSEHQTGAAPPSVAEARKYLESHPELTLAARNLNEFARARPPRARRLLSRPGRTPPAWRRAGLGKRPSAPRFGHSNRRPDGRTRQRSRS